MTKLTMEYMAKYAREYGFVYQGSEIYGGLANTWDFGPLGAKLKNNIKNAWRKRYIEENKKAYEIDADILMHPRVWEASGHTSGFQDPLIDCKSCKMRYVAEKLIDSIDNNAHAEAMTTEEMDEYIKNHSVKCPNCGSSNFTNIREFNLLFETSRGVIDSDKNKIYLRPENAQGEYVNYLNVKRTTRSNLPFAIGQVGKAFRNEITPGNFFFRIIEFEQMEFQTFCSPKDAMNYYEYYKTFARKFFNDLGIEDDKLKFHDHEKLIFYAKAACDIEYLFPFGWGELNGTHHRSDYDLTQHQKFSKVNMEYTDHDTKEKYIPNIIESTVGADRLTLVILLNAYHEETLEDGTTREVMKFHPYLAPYKVAVFPLIKKYHSEKADEVFNMLSKHFATIYDETGSIGKRYRRSDAIGTPYAITIDDKTLEDNTVTIRDRDTMKQIRLNLEEVPAYIEKRIKFE